MKNFLMIIMIILLFALAVWTAWPAIGKSEPAPALTKITIIHISSDADLQGDVPSNIGYVAKRFSGETLYVKVHFAGTPRAPLLKESGTILNCQYDIQMLGRPVSGYIYTYKIPFSQLQANNQFTILSGSSNGLVYGASAHVGIEH